MYATERHEHITSRVKTSGRVSVADVSRELGVTAETIRRDLDQLESSGILRRVHGGAVSAARASVAEASLAERQDQRSDAKATIARAALRLIPATFSGSIVIDAGTTTAHLADLLVSWRPATAGQTLTVITNSVPIAATLHHCEHVELHLLGGRVRGITSAAVGSTTVDELGRFRPDIAFVGANGVSADFGLSTPDELEGAVKSAIVRGSRRAVVLADAAKLGEEALIRFAALDEIDTVITDEVVPATLGDALEAAGVEVVVA